MRGAVVLAIVMLAGCSREPDFDERYEAATKQVGATAKAIDEEIDRRASAASPQGQGHDAPAPSQQEAGSPPDNQP